MTSKTTTSRSKPVTIKRLVSKEFFGSYYALTKKAGRTRQAAAKWGDYLPADTAYRLAMNDDRFRVDEAGNLYLR